MKIERSTIKLIQNKIWMHLNADHRTAATSWTNIFVVIAIITIIAIVSIETEENLPVSLHYYLHGIEITLWFFFIIEWILRVWTCPYNPSARGKNPYFEWIKKPTNLIDTFTILLGLAILIPNNGESGLWLRLFRIIVVFRYLRYTKRGRASYLLIELFKRQGKVLTMCFSFLVFLCYIMSCLLWLVEKDINQGLSSIPRAFWWSIVTMGTVGYGDVVPITALGKIIAGFFIFISMAFVALPGAIMAGGFINLLQEERDNKRRALEAVLEKKSTDR